MSSLPYGYYPHAEPAYTPASYDYRCAIAIIAAITLAKLTSQQRVQLEQYSIALSQLKGARVIACADAPGYYHIVCTSRTLFIYSIFSSDNLDACVALASDIRALAHNQATR